MFLKNFNPRTSLLLVFIFAVAMVRVAVNFYEDIALLANFSPIGAMAIFGGACFHSRTKGFAFPILMLFISDLILHQTVYKNAGNGFLYSGWYWVYGSFVLMAFAGRLILSRFSVGRFLYAALTCVLIHWIVSDIGVWAGSTLYAQNAEGFIRCLVNAIPFEWRFLTGTLVYGALLFGLFEWMQKKYPALQHESIF